MASPNHTTIALVGSGPELTDIVTALRGLEDVTFERREDGLSELNGQAVRLAGAADIILFRADPAGNLDIETLRSVQRSSARTATMVALTPPELPLSEARRLLQAGAADVLPWTVDPSELLEQIDRWKRRQLPAIYEPPSRRGRVVTVAQARGGVGASTLAVNLADRLQDKRGLRKTARNKVVVVDLDLQFGSVASLLDVKESEAFFQMATNGTLPDATFVGQALTSTKGGLWVLGAPTKFLPLEAVTPAQITTLLDTLTQQFDYVVVDLPRTLVLWVAAVLERTDRLLLVTDCTVPAVRQARRLIDLYLENNPTLHVEVVMSQEHKPLIRGSHHLEASKLLERPFRHWLPFDPRAARKAADRGMPMSVMGSSSLSKAVALLGRDTLAALARPAPATARA